LEPNFEEKNKFRLHLVRGMAIPLGNE
jgi:hypothetical protein